MTDSLGFDDVRAAARAIEGLVHRTAVHRSRSLDASLGVELFFKCENFQRGGAFKARGAFNAIGRLPASVRERGVVAFSSGNHAQGVAIAARHFGIPATVCMPTDAPSAKVNAVREYGASVLTYERTRVDREQFAQSVAKDAGCTIVPPFDHPHIIAGQGTATLELLDQVPDLDAIVLPVGGGGLISGAALARDGAHPRAAIFGVETDGADDTKQSLVVGRRVAVKAPSTIADGIRTERPGELTFPIVQRSVEDVLVVSDEQVVDAMQFLFFRMKIVVEPTGAVAFAAVLSRRLPNRYKRIGVVVSGGNIDPSSLRDLIVFPKEGRE